LISSGVIPLFASFGPLHEVATDAHGLSSSALRALLESWPADNPKPKMLYTTPVRLSFSHVLKIVLMD
jgi:tryptophan aminotransferase